MYHQYFGLSEAPFSIAVNPRYLFMSARHRDALAHLLYGVGAGGGFILLTGEVGTGKTTINRCLLEQLPDDTDVAIILNPALDALELLASVCDELGIAHDRERPSLKSLTDELHRFLLENHERGRKTVLLIDEAQHLDFDVLEQIRLLTNLETHSEKLLQIVLIGQPELAAMLQRPELRQLNQRITARYNLEALDLGETRAYIRHRLQVAGLAPDRELFGDALVRLIHRHTRGIPRLINVLCDRALLGAYGRNRPRADRATVQAAAREVLGEQAVKPRRWPWWLAAGTLPLVLLGLWSLWPATPAPEMPIAAPAPATAPPVASAEAAPVTASPVSPPAPVQPPEESTWILSPAAASTALWALHTPDPPPGDACAPDWPNGLSCYRDSARTWDALRAFDRPVVLELVTPERFGAAALLLALGEESATLTSADGGVLDVPLGSLAPLWTGDFFLYWRPPQGYQRPLSRGDSGPVVATVARQLASLDGQSAPLAGSRFNAALEQRVTLFQRAHGLVADGVIGVRTLLELQEQLGEAVSGAAALPSLAPGGTE